MVKHRAIRFGAILLLSTIVGGCADDGADQGPVTPLNNVAAAGSAESHLATGPDGTVVMSWLERDGDDVALKFSVLDGGEWTAPRMIARSNSWFVNWADFPSVVPMGDGVWGAHWLKKQPGGTFSYDVEIAVSDDDGVTWSLPVTPHDDGTPTEHGFVSLFPQDGGVGALWLDGRNMVGDHGAGGGGMTLRSAVIHGAGEVTDGRLVDGLVCDCCQTDVALGAHGPIAVYRNRTEEEIRDIYVTRFVDDAWQPGIAVADDGWEIAGCPVNGPAIVAAGDDVAVAWFTAANDEPRVKIAWSTDAAETFGPPTEIDHEGSLGRVGILLLDDGDALVSWLRDADGGSADVRVARVAPDGEIRDSLTVASTGAGRLSGFPQMTIAGERVVLSWTDTTVDETVVRSALLDPAALAVE